MSNLNSLAHFWPELILTVTILIAIIADLFYRRENSFNVAWWVLGGLALSLFAIRLGGGNVTNLFMGTVALDPFANFFKILILLSTALVILMSFNSKELRISPKKNDVVSNASLSEDFVGQQIIIKCINYNRIT